MYSICTLKIINSGVVGGKQSDPPSLLIVILSCMYMYMYLLLCSIGCELILCAPGYICVGDPVTGSAYCDPICDDTSHCGVGKRCTLIDGDCPPDQSEPCPHQVRCISVQPGKK